MATPRVLRKMPLRRGQVWLQWKGKILLVGKEEEEEQAGETREEKKGDECGVALAASLVFRSVCTDGLERVVPS